MANANVQYTGQVNGTGATDALFLKQYSGETLVAFKQAVAALPRTMKRTITQGKSAQFPAFGRTTAYYHTPGVEITGQTMNQAERVITVDQLLISPVFISLIDEAMAHYDVRSVYSNECGEALAKAADSNILQVGLLAARTTTPTVTGLPGGASFANANYKTDSTTLAGGLYLAAQTFDEKSIPETERTAYIRPAQYYLLAQNTTAINTLFGGNGSYADGKVVRIAGIELVKSLNLPQSNITTGPSAYQVDGTNTAALVLHKTAVGTVQLLGLATEMAYDIRRQGTLIVSKYAMGHGILRPEAGVELKTA
ncbi:phage capsid protein [Aquabacterium sp.]|uniref:phage capsid protein n=1 Tax=Aquabacterium sp. TaxID=1872578 RepID=UPI004037EB7C